MEFSKSSIAALIKAIYTNRVNVFNLPKKLYFAIADHLKSGIYKGYAGNIQSFEYNSPDFAMIRELRTNVYLFSGAKTFNYVLGTEGLILEGDKILPFKEFRKRAEELYDLHNKTWLQAEYDTAIGQAQSARAWVNYERESKTFPLLKYITVHDSNVSAICRSIDGVTKPVKDPFWNTHAPLNHYNCRCHLEQVSEGESTDLSKRKIVSPIGVFGSNPGKTGEVFTKHHPYFTEVPEKYKKLAKENFKLPIPNKD